MTFKKQLLCILLLSVTSFLFSQNNFTVDGNTYALNTEVEGSLTLLWNTIEGEYRYFSKKGNDIKELTNTKQNGSYQEEYKSVLASQTSDASIPLDGVNLTLPSLSRFFNAYNKAIDPSFEVTEKTLDLELRLGAFGGITNSRFTSNPDNVIGGIFGAEVEVTGTKMYRRHALVLRANYTPEASDYVYSATQASLNYRFKFIQQTNIDLYGNLKAVSFTNFTREREVENNDGSISLEKDTGNNFQISGILGLGADIPLGAGFVTVFYDDILGVGVKSNGSFPINLTVGYKIKL